MSAPAVPAWAYQAPRRPENHPRQCYYRADRFNHMVVPGGEQLPENRVTLFRFDTDVVAELRLETENARLGLPLSVPQLQLLRAALNDALQDIAAAQAEKDRNDAFEAIRREIDEAGDRGTGVRRDVGACVGAVRQGRVRGG